MFKRTHNGCSFTVVESVVAPVIAIILTGIVVLSLVGITGRVRSKAAAQELDIVQSAFDTLMIEAGAVTISEYLASGGVSVGPSTVITCYKQGRTTITVPTSDYYLRLWTTSTGKYTWDSEGLVRQASY